MTYNPNFTHIQQSEASAPSMEPSEEASKRHLELAKEQGASMQAALDEMTQNVAQGGGEKPAGNYLVGYAFEDPEGMYHLEGGQLKWKDPIDENIHIEISVRDGGDGRFVPSLNVHLTVLDANGMLVGTHKQPFLWHPWLYHYGRNWQLPGSGLYTFKIHIDAPDFPRHDKENGKRYAKPVDMVFEDIEIETKEAGNYLSRITNKIAETIFH